MLVPMDSFIYHTIKRKAVFATHRNPHQRRWGIDRVAESAPKEPRARGSHLWEVWTADERLIGSGVAADDMVD